jgi:hypothetical protein
MLTAVQEVARVQCPYCFEVLELYVDPDTRGQMVQDCDVCCRPWQLYVERGEAGELYVTVDRAQ